MGGGVNQNHRYALMRLDAAILAADDLLAGKVSPRTFTIDDEYLPGLQA